MSSILLNVHVVVFSISEDKLRVLLTPLQLHSFSPPKFAEFGGSRRGTGEPEGSSEKADDEAPGDQPQLWSLPGAPVHADASLDDAASHSVAPYVDRQQAHLEQLYTYGGPERGGPGPRLVSVAYFALVPAHALTHGGSPEGGWFPLYGLPALAEDHADIIAYALRRLRYKLEYSAAGFQLLPEEFSLSELQHTYEIILGERLDKRNFRRRILEAGIIEPTSHRRSGEGRPARLYRYRPDAVAEIRARRLFP
jgi:8-oxo-dGTP diphosphatase